jgi:hypothetical protein
VIRSRPGGKGLNVARTLRAIGAKVTDGGEQAAVAAAAVIVDDADPAGERVDLVHPDSSRLQPMPDV